MNPRIYNVSLAVGVLLVGIGEGLVDIPRALMAVGAIVIVLTLATAALSRKF
jgi:hypothetical protein